jgi:hypothetical protein
MMLDGVFRVHATFPYMESEAVLNGKKNKNMEKSQKNIGMVDDVVGWCLYARHCIQGSYQGPLHISQKGNLS